MNETQRWLLKDLEAWTKRERERIGRYGPRKTVKPPPYVKSARRAIIRFEKMIKKWEQERDAPWNRAKEAIDAKAQGVRRIILFESTENALKAIKALK